MPTKRSQPFDSVDAIVDDVERSIAEGRLPARIFNDPDIHERELERIFARDWVFVAHESEIPSPGDYVLRSIGIDEFIVARDESGTIRVLFNGCRHRGTRVCRAEKGNTSHFRCPYHGWTYKNSGELIGTPAAREAYPNLDKQDWSLLAAPHVGMSHGLIFASLDSAAAPLSEHLGGIEWYLETLFGLTPGGMEVIGEPQRWVLDSNWKIGQENLGGDDYHVMFLHKSMFEVGSMRISPPSAALAGYKVIVADSHHFETSPDTSPNADFPGIPDELRSVFGTGSADATQVNIARRSRIILLTVFPNLGFLSTQLPAAPGHDEDVSFTIMRQWQPIAPGKTEVWNWMLTWKEAPPDFRERSLRAATANFSPSGMYEQDDTVPWQSMVKSAGSQFFGKRNVALHYGMGLNGSSIARQVDDWPGPGTAFSPRFEEEGQRQLYRRWARSLRRP